jgi:hypothetical protein
MSRRISSDSRSMACETPRWPAIDAAETIGHPTKTKSAPRPSAFNTSVPRYTPLTSMSAQLNPHRRGRCSILKDRLRCLLSTCSRAARDQ